MEDYYVYEHWRPDMDQPFYVGKGRGNRARIQSRRGADYAAVIAVLQKEGLSVCVQLVREGLAERSAFAAEMERIAYWRSRGVALVNRTEGGDGTWGAKYTEERRQKLRTALRGKKRTPEQCQRMSAARRGRALSEEHKQKLRAAGSARSLSPEHKQRIREALRGRPKTAEHKANLRAALRYAMRPPRSLEARARMSAAQKKRIISPEGWVRIKTALSLAHKGKIMSTASREKMRAAQGGRTHSAETKEKMRLAALLREASKRARVETHQL